jgi:hypothetical protein
MAIKRRPVRQQEKIVIRLPDGMRERIQASAKRHDVSTNEEIVNILVRFFPPPATLTDEIYEVGRIMEVLRKGADAPKLAALRDSIDDLVRGIVKGRVGAVPDEVRQGLMNALEYYDEQTFKESGAQYYPAGEEE